MKITKYLDYSYLKVEKIKVEKNKFEIFFTEFVEKITMSEENKKIIFESNFSMKHFNNSVIKRIIDSKVADTEKTTKFITSRGNFFIHFKDK